VSADCTYCRKMANLDQLSAEDLVWKFPTSVALLSPWQLYQGYCILVYRTHASELSQLNDEDRLNFLDEMCLTARAIERGFQPRKMNYEMLGNQTPHMHWHLIPRYRHDPHPADAVWVALDRIKDDRDERKKFRTGPQPRTETIALLQKQLQSLHAPGSP
jgi:diadenosine tetraphosphate (Ap4A) HIT family hydrolase